MVVISIVAIHLTTPTPASPMNLMVPTYNTVSYMANELPMFVAASEFDRPRGIFTPRDRRFLADELDEELSGNEKRQKRYQIRRRLLHALQDLRYLGVMETSDLGQIVEKTQGAEGNEDTSPETARFKLAMNEFLAFLREVYDPITFRDMVMEQIEIQDKLEHYEEKGEYSEIELTLIIEQTETYSIEELKEKKQSQTVSPPGVDEVLSLADEMPPFESGLRYEPEYPALMDTAIEMMESEGGVTRETLSRLLVSREGVSGEVADQAIDDALFSGECYEDKSGKLVTI